MRHDDSINLELLASAHDSRIGWGALRTFYLSGVYRMLSKRS